MDRIIISIFNFGICVFDEYMLFALWNCFLKSKIKNGKWLNLIKVLLAAIMFIINTFGNSKINLAAAFLIHICACIMLYEEPLKKKIFFSIFGCLLLILSDIFFICLTKFGVLVKSIDLTHDYGKRLVAITITKLLAFFTMRLVCRKANIGKYVFFPAAARYFYIFPLASLILFIGIDYTDIKFTFHSIGSIMILFGCFLLLFANVILLAVYEKMTLIMVKMKETEIMNMKNTMEQEHYERIEEINKKHAEMLHSIMDYLATIKALAIQDDNGNIIKIAEDIDHKVIELGEANFCDNIIINAILKEKEWEAKKVGTAYKVFVEKGFSMPDIREIDLISILCNIINNALEASAVCEQGFVNIQMFRANDGRFSIIKISNNFSKYPVIRGGIFISLKTDHATHGIGIKYTKALVENYGGLMQSEIVEQEFITTIMFFCDSDMTNNKIQGEIS